MWEASTRFVLCGATTIVSSLLFRDAHLLFLTSFLFFLAVCFGGTENTQGIIFVVDSNDPDRLDGKTGGDSAKEELAKMLAEDELRDAVLLVFANKQDLPQAIPVKQLTERLGLNTLRGRKWFIQASCATTVCLPACLCCCVESSISFRSLLCLVLFRIAAG